jgi:hypothetical protein
MQPLIILLSQLYFQVTRRHFAVLNLIVEPGTDVVITDTVKHQHDNGGDISVNVTSTRFGLPILRR